MLRKNYGIYLQKVWDIFPKTIGILGKTIEYNGQKLWDIFEKNKIYLDKLWDIMG